jgi:hypothetical protein
MKNEELTIEEDAALAAAVRQAFDIGEVPERLRLGIHDAAEREWVSSRRRRRQRMHAWLSGLTSMAAAAVILMYSGAAYFGRPNASSHDDKYRNLNEIMDLVTLSYPEEDLTDEELDALQLPSRTEVTRDYVAARIDGMLAVAADDYFGE